MAGRVGSGRDRQCVVITAPARPSRLADLKPRPAGQTAPVTETVPPAAVERCYGYWFGPDAAHTPHTPCPNQAQWAGLSEHDHAKTTLRCTTHRDQLTEALRGGTLVCLTCHGPIRSMTWREL